MDFYIQNIPGVGYIVTAMENDNDGYISTRYLRNFGERQSDAIEFRDDCRNGKIDYKRIKQLADTYTDTPYRYLGKGNVRKTNESKIQETK